MSGAFNVEGLKKLARDDPSRVVALVDNPDNLKANFRMKKSIAQDLPENVLYDLNCGCVVHLLHTLISTIVKEDKVVGHVHACQFVLGIQTRRVALLENLRELVAEELRIEIGEPPEDVSDQLCHAIVDLLTHCFINFPRLKNIPFEN